MKPTRINYSQQTLDLLTYFADYEGHGSLSAALATVVKFGVPYLISQRQQTPTTLSEANNSFVVPTSEASTIEEGETIEIDDTIARLSLLLEEF